MNPDERRAYLDARQEQMFTARGSFECALEFDDWDMAEESFNTAMQIAWEAIILHAVDADQPLLDPTRTPNVTSIRRMWG